MNWYECTSIEWFSTIAKRTHKIRMKITPNTIVWSGICMKNIVAQLYFDSQHKTFLHPKGSIGTISASLRFFFIFSPPSPVDKHSWVWYHHHNIEIFHIHVHKKRRPKKQNNNNYKLLSYTNYLPSIFSVFDVAVA